jgi:hypothetical protein
MNIYLSAIVLIAIPNKYTKWYCELVENARKRATTREEAKALLGYVEGHHIFPRSFEEDNSERNFAYFTLREHYLAHLFLTKMFDEQHFQRPMIEAAWIMVNGFQTRTNNDIPKISSKKYQILKKLFLDTITGKSFTERYGHLKAEKIISQMKQTKANKTAEEKQIIKSKLQKANLGKKQTAETIEKKRSLMLGVKFSEEHKERISNALKGRERSKEHCDNLSKAMKNREPYSTEYKAKMSISCSGEKNGMFGRKHSDETKRKISEAKRRNKLSANALNYIQSLRLSEEGSRD